MAQTRKTPPKKRPEAPAAQDGQMTTPAPARAAVPVSAPPVQMLERPMAAPPMMSAEGGATGIDNALQPTPAAEILPARPVNRITKERLTEAMHTLHKYKAGKSSLERRIIAAQEWWKLKNWEQHEMHGVKGSHSSKSNTAWLWNCIVGKHADYIDSYPEPVILPRMQDDKPEAQRLSAILPVVMEVNGFEQTYNDCGWQKMLEGTAAYGVFWDKDKLGGLGDIALKRINVLNLFWEPGVNDIQDSQHVFSVALMDNERLEQEYPQLVGKLKTPGTASVAKYRYDDNVPTDNKSLVVDWYYHRYDGGKKALHYVKFVGEEVLFATENDPEMALRGLYDDAEYPFVLDPLFPVEGSPCGYGYVEVARDTQQDIDLISQALVTNATMSATPRYFVRKDGGVNVEEFADWSKPLVTCNGNLAQDTVRPVEVNVLPGNAVEMLQQKIEEIKFITGNTDVQNGSVPSGVTSGVAIAALREDSGRSSKDSNKASYRAYRRLVTMVIERMRQFYDLPRTFRILGEMGEESFTVYSNAALKMQPQGMQYGVDMGYRLPVFDIEVRAQRENAYTKMAQNDLAIQLWGLGIFNPQLADQALLLLDTMDFKGREELMQKIQRQAGMMQMLQATLNIAIALAQQYNPAVAPQLMAMAQSVGMAVPAAAPATGAVTAGGEAGKPQEATETGTNPQETRQMETMRGRVSGAARPNE